MGGLVLASPPPPALALCRQAATRRAVAGSVTDQFDQKRQPNKSLSLQHEYACYDAPEAKHYERRPNSLNSWLGSSIRQGATPCQRWTKV